MATTLESFFSLPGDAKEENRHFYDLIKDQTNSGNCHKKLALTFAQVLMLNSYRYRNEPVPYSKTYIPDEGKLNLLLDYLPEDMKNPLVQVLFEQVSLAPKLESKSKTESNSIIASFPTAENEGGKASLEKSVGEVRAIEYAKSYNDLIQSYKKLDWVKEAKNPLPGEIENPSLAKVPTIKTVHDTLIDLSNWINKNDPVLIIIKSSDGLSRDEIINKVFESDSPKEFVFQFVDTLLAKILLEDNKQGPIRHYKVTFFELIQEKVKNRELIRNRDSGLEKLAEQIAGLNSDEFREKPQNVFNCILDFFNAGLKHKDYESFMRDCIKGVIDSFISKIVKGEHFLDERIEGTFKVLKKYMNENLGTIAQWIKEVSEENPNYIYGEYIEVLMSIACDVLSSIPLMSIKSDFANGNIKDIRLFYFSDLDVIWKCNNKVFVYDEKNKKADQNIIRVTCDAGESIGVNKRNFYRPIYEIKYGKNKVPTLKFFNVGDQLADGVFYFIDAGQPTRVLSQEPISDKPIEFNFKDATINKQSEEMKLFYEKIKNLSKWKNLNGKQSYDVLYEICSESSTTPNAHLIWRLPSGGGLNRAERVDDDSLILWEHCLPMPNNYPYLGEVLNLPPSRRIVRHSLVSPTIMVGNDTYKIINEGNDCFYKIAYCFIKIQKNAASAVETYVLANTPHPNLSEEINLVSGNSETKPIVSASGGMLSIFNFKYYRKVCLADPKEPVLIKQIPADSSPQRPQVADGIELGALVKDEKKVGTEIGISLPISFRINENISYFKKLTGPGGELQSSLKNKGRPLYRSQGARRDAGSVMKDLRSCLKLPPGTQDSLPATAFGNWALAKSLNVLTSWRNLKNTKRDSLPTNQEWCHIQGHGDGGKEHLGNFVCGSFHCNTEQLAIESGQRNSTHSENHGTYTLLSTAYLFKSDQDLLHNKNYLQYDDTYKQTVGLHKKLRVKGARVSLKDTGAGQHIPFAGLIRYKIEMDSPTGRVKVFEHIFEGQSEFFDVHQFNILSKTTKFVLAGYEAFDKWYKEQGDARKKGAAEKIKEGKITASHTIAIEEEIEK